jgi:hypothetical protein
MGEQPPQGMLPTAPDRGQALTGWLARDLLSAIGSGTWQPVEIAWPAGQAWSFLRSSPTRPAVQLVCSPGPAWSRAATGAEEEGSEGGTGAAVREAAGGVDRGVAGVVAVASEPG